MNSVGQTKLQLRLENDEPKCLNCKWWGRTVEAIGIAQCNHIMNKFDRLSVVTTDLSVCSKWEPK